MSRAKREAQVWTERAMDQRGKKELRHRLAGRNYTIIPKGMPVPNKINKTEGFLETFKL